MQFLIVFLLLLFVKAISAQVTFQKAYGDIGSYQGYTVLQTNDGGYVVAGGGSDFCLVRTDVNGDTLWTKTFGGTGTDEGYSLTQTSDGGYIIAGTTYNATAGTYQIYLVKTDSAGTLNWSKTIGGTVGEGAYSILQTNDGGYIVAGYTLSFSAGNGDIYLIKTDSTGNILWTKTFGGIDGDMGKSISQTADGGYIIVGYTLSFGVDDDILVIKTDSIGNITWSKTYGDIDTDYGGSIKQTTDGGYIIGGSRHQTNSLIFKDMALIKTDSAGNILWTKNYGGGFQDGGTCVQQTTDGGYILVGGSNSFGDVNIGHAYAVKTDANGNITWSKIYGETDNHVAFSVQQSTAGGYIIAGSTNPIGPTNKDIYLIKTDSLGNSGCHEENAATLITTPVIATAIPAWIESSGGIAVSATTTVNNLGDAVDLCAITGINEITTDNSLLVSPNPFTKYFSVNGTSSNGVATIFDLTGKEMLKQKTLAGETTINTENLLPGFYLLSYTDGNKTAAVKLMKF